MEIKITTLNENSATTIGLAEWGLSMLVEAEGIRILFDTGMGIAAAHNAQLMRVDLSSIDRIILSHGHGDHTGGLYDVLDRAGGKEVIAHPDIWGRKYGRRPGSGGPVRYIGIPFVRESLESLGASFRLSDKPVKLSKHIMTTGEIPMTNNYEKLETYLYVKEGEQLKQDSFKDDLALIIDAEYGLVVILGCAHRGIINTLKHAQKLTGKDLIYAAIGGTHLVGASKERLKKTAAALKEMGVRHLGVSHCTGFESSAYLAQEFGKRFFLNNSGSRWVLPFK